MRRVKMCEISERGGHRIKKVCRSRERGVNGKPPGARSAATLWHSRLTACFSGVAASRGWACSLGVAFGWVGALRADSVDSAVALHSDLAPPPTRSARSVSTTSTHPQSTLCRSTHPRGALLQVAHPRARTVETGRGEEGETGRGEEGRRLVKTTSNGAVSYELWRNGKITVR